MKRFFQMIFRNYGFEVKRFKKSPYEFLKKAPRYTQRQINLLGTHFIIPDSLSFYYSYREIFIDEIYKFFTHKKNPRIIDCGSNYGTSIVYFKTLFPKAQIKAVEADPEIFSILKTNVDSFKYADVELYQNAIWKNNNELFFCHEGADGGRLEASETFKQKFRVRGLKIDEILNVPTDFLKIDIEGAETESLLASKNLYLVRNIFIEYHSFNNTAQSLDSILKKLKEFGFRYYIHHIHVSPKPFIEKSLVAGMDMQLNIYAKKMNN